MNEKAYIGAEGERLAAEWLAENGFRILHTNWRRGRYELDIVARRGGTVHFVEVKCRKGGGLTTPEEAITHAKFAALTKAAQAYIALYGIDGEVQFDLVAVEHDGSRWTVRYIPDAMQASW